MNKTINIKKIAIIGATALGLSAAGVGIINSQIQPAPVVQAASSSIKVSQSKAVKKFQAKYKKAKIESITLEKESGRYVYEIEGYTSTKECEMKINASSGKVISSKSEKRDGDTKRALNLKKTISRSAATKIAQKKVSGSKATKWTLEREGSKSIWEVTVTKNGQKSEVKINALTKKVISVERD